MQAQHVLDWLGRASTDMPDCAVLLGHVERVGFAPRTHSPPPSPLPFPHATLPPAPSSSSTSN